MVRKRQVAALEPWLWRVANSDLRALRSLLRDPTGQSGGCRFPPMGMSQGQVEGNVNRLKLVKQSMFGRAKFDLLRQRVLYTT